MFQCMIMIMYTTEQEQYTIEQEEKRRQENREEKNTKFHG